MIKKPDDILKVTVYLVLFLFFGFLIISFISPPLGHSREINQMVNTKHNLRILGHFMMDEYYIHYNKRPQYLRDLFEFAENNKLFEAYEKDGKDEQLFLAQKDSFGIPILFSETKVGSNERLMFSSAGINKRFGDDDDITIYWPQSYKPQDNYKLPPINYKNPSNIMQK